MDEVAVFSLSQKRWYLKRAGPSQTVSEDNLGKKFIFHSHSTVLLPDLFIKKDRLVSILSLVYFYINVH